VTTVTTRKTFNKKKEAVSKKVTRAIAIVSKNKNKNIYINNCFIKNIYNL